MVNVYTLNLKSTETESVRIGNDVKRYGIEQTVFPEFRLNKSYCNSGCINGNVEGFEEIRQSAYMVLMSVSDYNTLYFIRILLHIRKIGNYKVNSEHILVGEGQTAVNDNHGIVILIKGHILSDFVKSAEESYSDGLCFLL